MASGYDGIEVVQDCIEHLTYLQRDLTNAQDLDFSEWFGPDGGDVVVHLAAMSGVKDCSAVPLSAFYINLEATFALLDGAADFDAQCFVFASSGAVVAGLSTSSPSEDAPPRPPNIYGSMKAAAEQLCRGFSEERGLPTSVLRFSNVYGPHSAHKTSAVHRFVRDAIEGKQLQIHGDGTQTRDFVFVGDVVHAIIGAGNFAFDGAKVFHVSTGVETPILDTHILDDDNKVSLYYEICEAVGKRRPPVRSRKRRSWGWPNASINSDVTRRVLCIGSPTPLSNGIRETVAWYRNDD